MRRYVVFFAALTACSTPDPNFADASVDSGMDRTDAGGERDGGPDSGVRIDAGPDAGGVACPMQGFAECDGDETELCESYVWADEAHCGTCEASCSVDRLCVAAACDVVILAEAGLGAGHTCVRTTSQHVLCWGHNSRGQLGDGTHDDVTFARDRPDAVAVLELTDAVDIDVDGYTGCAIRGLSRTVSCWGDNSPNRFGPITDAISLYARPEALLGATDPVEEVSVTGSHVCVRTATDVLCAGSNASGALGRADSGVRTTVLGPMEGLPVGMTPLSIATGGPGGYGHTCVVMSNRRVYCTGSCDSGQCGQADVSNLYAAEEVVGLTDIVEVDAGRAFTCALDGSGDVWCWGSNGEGELGNESIGGMDATPRLVAALGMPAMRSIATGYGFVLAVSVTGDEVWGWGAGDDGQLGRGASMLTATGTPVRILGVAGASYDAYAGGTHACLIERRGTTVRLLCAGANGYGELGGLSGSLVPMFEQVPAIP